MRFSCKNIRFSCFEKKISRFFWDLLLVRLVTSLAFHKHILRATMCEHRPELWGFSSESGSGSPPPSSAEHLAQAATGRVPSLSCRHAHWPLKRGWKAYWRGGFQAHPAAGSLVLWLLSRANRVNLIKCCVFRDISEVKKRKKWQKPKSSAYYFRFLLQSLDSGRIPKYLR